MNESVLASSSTPPLCNCLRCPGKAIPHARIGAVLKKCVEQGQLLRNKNSFRVPAQLAKVMARKAARTARAQSKDDAHADGDSTFVWRRGVVPVWS